MQPLRQIDFFAQGRKPPTPEHRQAAIQQRHQQAREAGYQQLAALCHIGEEDAAKQLAQHHRHWGYEVIDGTIQDKLVD